jgi:hypothetical protein
MCETPPSTSLNRSPSAVGSCFGQIGVTLSLSVGISTGTAGGNPAFSSTPQKKIFEFSHIAGFLFLPVLAL